MRLIDADKLIDEIINSLWDWESVDGITATTVLKQTITDIGNQQTIDAVPVVRCKDCRYWLPMNRFQEGFHPGKGECELDGWVQDSDWYCADGKRQEGR